MPSFCRGAIVLLALTLCAGATPAARAQQTTPLVARPAPPELIAELQPIIELARRRFDARDAAGVLAHVSEQYRSGGLTKADLRQQILAMFSLYEAIRTNVTINQVQLVDGAVWIYTTGGISGRLPFLGWVSMLAWQNEPEVVRREEAGWRLFGFQN
jgi:hypothetical protein